MFLRQQYQEQEEEKHLRIMSLSKNINNQAGYTCAPETLQLSDFFACQNQLFLITSDNEEPLHSFARLDLSEKTILFFTTHDADTNVTFPGARVAKIQIRTWVQVGIFLRHVVMPIDFIVLDRVDLWDLDKSKKRKGALRTAILSSLTPNFLQGTNVVVTLMGEDVGLKKLCDKHFPCQAETKTK